VTTDILSNMVTRGAVAGLVLMALACAAPRQGAPSEQARAPEPLRPDRLAPPPGAIPQDLDGDGKPDAWTVPPGETRREERLYDLDGDGGPDVALSFESGRLVSVEILRQVESLPPAVSRFEGGRLASPAPDPARGEGVGSAPAPAQK
jgi:hypothetical protein